MDAHQSWEAEPLFAPSGEDVAASEMTRFAEACGAIAGRPLDAEGLHRFSIDAPERFWKVLLEWLGLRTSGDRAPALVGLSLIHI